MRFITFIAPLLLSGLASAASFMPVERAVNSSTQLVNQIKVISTDITKLNNTLNKFKPNSGIDAINALVIQVQTDQIGKDLTKATSIANASAPYTLDESATIAQAVLNLEPNIASLLNNIVAHKPAFSTVLGIFDLSKTVEQDLITQKGQANAFGTAVAAKLAGIFGFFAPAVNTQIQGYFTTAIAAYQACTGNVCLPPITF